MAVNQKEADSEHVLSSISEMTSVIGSGITQRKFQIYSLQGGFLLGTTLPPPKKLTTTI